jgi:RNA polymerase sigma-70 factor (ECF subfamily)
VDAQEDKDRFASLILPLLHDAYGLARALTGNRADAEDVVQDACLRAFRAIAGLAGSPRPWLLAIVRHTAYTWLGKNRPAALVMVDDLEAVERQQAAPAPHDAATPESALIDKVEAAQLEAAIAALPMPFRETVVLRDVHGLDYQEISRVTGVPMGTVMSRLARGRARLAAALGPREP